MKITFDTALFGESNKAHSLLSSSDIEFAKSLTPITDLPLDLPLASGHAPMLSGFPHEGRYVFLCSTRDTDASRAGMALTTALITDIANCGLIQSISTISKCLNQGPRNFSASRFEIEFNATHTVSSSPGTVALVRALMTTHISRPVVWIGQEGFCEAFDKVWDGLPSAMRRAFAFRFCCTPRDGRTAGATLVYTPIECRIRWKDYSCVTPPFDDRPATQVERLFSDRAARTVVLSWGEDLGADVTSFETFRLLADAQVAFERRALLADLDVTVLCRNLARLVPNQSKGMTIKAVAITEVEKRIKSGPLNVIGYLRNFSFNEFVNGAASIRNATAIRIGKAIRSGEDIVALAREAITDGERPWALGVLIAFIGALKEAAPPALNLFWLLVRTSVLSPVRDWLVQTSKSVAGLEHVLLKQKPPVQAKEGSAVISFCNRASWAEMHAYVVAATESPFDAITKQIAFEPANAAGLAELSRCLGPRVFVAAAINCGNLGRLLDQIVSDCIVDIGILDQASIAHPGWRAVVCGVIHKSENLIDQQHVLDEQVQVMWQLVRQGQPSDSQLLDALSRTKYANIIDVRQRPAIWDLIPDATRAAFVKSTASAWLSQTRSHSHSEDIEEPLRAEILSIKCRSQLLPTSDANAVMVAIQRFRTFTELRQADFDEWRIRLLTVRRQLTHADATMIGAFLASKRWDNCARALFADYVKYNRYDLHPALCECRSAFGFITRYRYSLSSDPVTSDQWWEALSDVMLDLYPEGPSDKNLWERCGGHLADLKINASGRKQWKKVLAEFRNGATIGGASVHSLIRVCRHDYYANSDLELLVDKCPFQLDLSNNDAFID